MKNKIKFGFVGDIYAYLIILILSALILISCKGDDDVVVVDTSGIDTIDVFKPGDVCYSVNYYKDCSQAQKVVFDGLILKLTHKNFWFNTVLEYGTIDIDKRGSDIYHVFHYFEGQGLTRVKMTEGTITLDSVVNNRIYGSFKMSGRHVEQHGVVKLDTTMNFSGTFEGVEYE